MGTAIDLGRVRRRIQDRLLVTAVPAAGVVGWVLAVMLGLSRQEALQALVRLLLPVVAALAVTQRLVISRLFRRAVAERPGDPPGARLLRLLELPRRIEVLVHGSVWAVGSLVFTAAACALFQRSAWLVPVATLVGLLAALFPGLLLGNLLEQELLPVVLEELGRTGPSAVRGRALFWPRRRWYLPYAFTVAITSLIGLGAVLLASRGRETAARLAEELRAQGLEPATGAVARALDRLLGAAAVELGGLALFLLIGFVGVGLLLARREARAAAAVEEALQALAQGRPAPPAWASTDELGDLARSAAVVASQMEQVFAQLRAVAGGDLSQEWRGESGLAVAFRESQASMLQLARLMVTLSRGELGEEADIPGELGRHVAQLQAAFRAMVSRAQTISRGDLRSDVEVPGALGQALRRMTENLRGMVGQTQGVSGELGDLVVELQAAAAQLSAATAEQVSAVSETAATMAEMAQTTAVSADRAVELIGRGDAAALAVEEGGQAADSSVETMVAITTALESVSVASAALADKTRLIDGVTETVGLLADQSSTLAINAAIEAARAGEAGKGFAVVAREIRELATDSRRAAAEIQALLGQIRERTAQVDAAVTAGADTVLAGTRNVEQLAEVVTSLGATLHEAVGLMRQVEGSARQHQAGVVQVSRAMAATQRAAESIRDGAGRLGDLSGRARELSEALRRTSGAYALPAGARPAEERAAPA